MYDIIDFSDPRSADTTCVINAAHLQSVTLIQCADDDNVLFAVATLKEKSFPRNRNRAAVFVAGHMSFHSTGGGMLALRDFRDWLAAHDLLKSATLKYTVLRAYKELIDSRVYYPSILVEHRDRLGEVFPYWARGEHDWWQAYFADRER
jgi:hypothetical protein